MAALRHGRDPRAVLEAFRALEHGGPGRRAGRARRGAAPDAERWYVRRRWHSRIPRPPKAPWVGRSVLRVEDDALLRGEGRFLDDLAPVARTLPRRRRALAARARPDRGRRDRGARAARRRRRPHRRRRRRAVAARSRPGSRPASPQYAAAIDTVRYVGEPIAVVVARDRYLAEDAAELVDGRLRPARRRARPGRGGGRRRPRPDVLLRRRRRGDGRRPTSSSARPSTFPRFTCTPVECYAVVADWDATAGRLTAWANFQGPFTLHGVAAAALGLKGDRLRLLTPPDSGGSFGIKSSVFAYVVLIGLAARHLGVPVTLDRGPARAPRGERRRDRAHDRGRGGLHRRRPADRAPLRRDRGRRRVRPRARAGDALPHARLALGRLPRPERRRAQPRRAHEHDPVRAQPRLRRAAALLRPRADDGDRRAPARPRPGRARAPQPGPGRRDALPHPVRGAVRLGRLRGLPRQGARARRLRRRCARGSRPRAPRAGSPGSASPASSSRRSRTWATSRSPRPPTSARRSLPKSGNAEGASIAIDPLGGITVRLATTPQGQGHRTVCAQVVADVLGCAPDDVTVLSEMDTASVPWTVASGNYSSRFSGVAVGAVQAAALKLRAKIDAIRAHAGDESALAAPRRRHGALEPRGAAGRRGAGPRGGRLLGAADPRSARRRRPRRLVGRPRLHRRRLRRRGRAARRARCACSTTSPCTTPGGSSTRCSPTGRCSAASPTASRPRSTSATSTTSGAT